MKIALVNYRYFFSGGPERYMFNIKEILEKNGHEVIPFSVKQSKNERTIYDKYFLDPIGDGHEVYFGEYKKKSIKSSIKGLGRMLYSFEAKRKFMTFLEETKPDIIYILYFQNKISCSIIDVANSLGIPMVQRISDYSLIAPCSIFYRYDTNSVCELCLNKGLLNAVKYKCVYNSYLYSFTKVLALKIQNLVNIQEKIATFIFPSKFTMDKFIDAGFDVEKMRFVPTLFNTTTVHYEEQDITYEPFALYVGRTDPDKGLLTLLDAFIGTEFKLKIIGFSNGGYHDKLVEYVKDKQHNIEFLGKMDFQDIQKYLKSCLFTVIPSEWYDNLPNSLLESFAFKKCVVATDIGSLSENIIHKKNGLLFKYKNVDSLKEQVHYLFSNYEAARMMGEEAYQFILTKFSVEKHYECLISIFKSVLNDKKNN